MTMQFSIASLCLWRAATETSFERVSGGVSYVYSMRGANRDQAW